MYWHYSDQLLGSFPPSRHSQCQILYKLLEAHLERCSHFHFYQKMKKQQLNDLLFQLCLNVMLQLWILCSQLCHCCQHLPAIRIIFFLKWNKWIIIYKDVLLKLVNTTFTILVSIYNFTFPYLHKNVWLNDTQKSFPCKTNHKEWN